MASIPPNYFYPSPFVQMQGQQLYGQASTGYLQAVPNVPVSPFSSILSAEGDVLSLVANIEALASKLTGAYPPAESTEIEPKTDGLLASLGSTARNMSRACARGEDALKRILSALP